jgi:hypothetical protein
MRVTKKITVVLLFFYDSEARNTYTVLVKSIRIHLKIKLNVDDMKMSRPIG